MKFAIKHEIKGRIRIHLAQKHMTYRQADVLQCYLENQANISKSDSQRAVCDHFFISEENLTYIKSHAGFFIGT